MSEQPVVGEVDKTAPEKSIASLFNGLPYRHFPPKHMIIYQGDKAERVYYIISGYARMYNITEKGNERTMVIFGPGEALPLIQSEIAQYFYDAMTEVEVTYGTYDEIVSRFMSDKDYMEAARNSSVHLMQRMIEQMEILSYDNSADKVRLALRFLAKYYGEERGDYRRIKFRITHQELANLVNLTRETVSQAINKFERKQFIKTGDNGHFLVLDVETENEDKKDSKDAAKLLKLGKTLRPYRPVSDKAI